MADLYSRIKERRKELQLSQDDLAKRLGYKSRSSINKIEKGINDIPHSKIAEIAKALQTTPEQLMGLEGNDLDYDIQQIVDMCKQLHPSALNKVLEFTEERFRETVGPAPNDL